VWPPAAGARALPIVLTNRGLLFPTSQEPQAPYELRCNEAYGVSTAVIPDLVLDPSDGGVLVMRTGERVTRTADRGCTFEPTFVTQGLGTSLGGLAVQSDPPGSLVLSTIDAEGTSDAGVSQVFVSEDYGRTWSWRADSPPAQGYLSMLAAPSRAQRLYAVGARIDPERGFTSIFARSDDGGQTWQQRDTESDLYLIGVHPQDPDVLFMREPANAEGTRWRVQRSTDGGESFTALMETDEVSSFAAKPDGSVLWLGVARDGGLFRSTDGGQSFVRVHPELVEVDCLVYRQGVLWLCANHEPNLDGIWAIEDASDKLDKVLTFERVTAPVACEGSAAQVCHLPWIDWQREILPDTLSPDAGVGVDAGLPPQDAGVRGDGSVDAGAAAPARPKDDGCSTRAASRSSSGAWASLLTLLAAGWLARRRSGRVR
jgi:photosystem II stability/assembly factor-like uncharacterized protein